MKKPQITPENKAITPPEDKAITPEESKELAAEIPVRALSPWDKRLGRPPKKKATKKQ
jgi:hypothetical protein